MFTIYISSNRLLISGIDNWWVPLSMLMARTSWLVMNDSSDSGYHKNFVSLSNHIYWLGLPAMFMPSACALVGADVLQTNMPLAISSSWYIHSLHISMTFTFKLSITSLTYQLLIGIICTYDIRAIVYFASVL